jgi:putative hydrolase of the HAD superfamily
MAKINPFDKLRVDPEQFSFAHCKLRRRIKAVFFDMGGVMVGSSVDDISRAVERFFKIKNFHFLNSAFSQDLFHLMETGKISEKNFWQGFSKKINRRLRRGWKKIIPHCLKKAKIRHKMKKLVLSLKQKGIKTAVLSNVSQPFAQRHYRLGHYRIFDYLILSCEVGFRKPDPRIFHRALSAVGVKPEESIFIDDKEKNIKAAEKIGIKGIFYKNTNQVWREVKRIIAFTLKSP